MSIFVTGGQNPRLFRSEYKQVKQTKTAEIRLKPAEIRLITCTADTSNQA